MSLDVVERRRLLRDALADDDPSGVDTFAAAIEGASEEDRKALTRTLPARRLLDAEGGTPRALYVFAALGRADATSEEMFAFHRPRLHSRGDTTTVEEEAAYRGLRGRSAAWLEEFVGSGWTGGASWEASRRLVRERGLQPTSLTYLSNVVGACSSTRDENNRHRYRTGDEIVAMLRSDDLLLTHDFWQLFRVEGMGSSWLLTDSVATGWTDAIRHLGETEPGFRDRVLDETLGVLLRDFSAKNIVWFHRLHRAMAPTPQEVGARTATYLAVLTTSPSVAVGLAQDMLMTGVTAQGFESGGVIDASGAVLARSEKKLVKAQLGLLSAIVRAHPEFAHAVSDAVAPAVPVLAPELRVAAETLIIGSSPIAEDDTPVAGEPVHVAGPRTRAIDREEAERRAIADDEELFALVADQLEGVGDGAELPRILDYVPPTRVLIADSATRSIALPAALRTRAGEIVETTWDANGTSPRRHLAAFLLNVSIDVRGYTRTVAIRDGEAPQAGMQVEEYTVSSSVYSNGVLTEQAPTTHRRGTLFFPSNGPGARLADYIGNHAATRPGRRDAPRVLPHRIRAWERRLVEPGEGRYRRDYDVLGAQPRAFWLAIGEGSPGTDALFEERILDVTDVAAEFTFRAQEAREQDGYDQIVQWAAWVLRESPATLAAHFHPALYVATQVVNVRGIGVLIAALGGSHLVPEAPVYSALALAASAKEAPHRAHAAEAIAQLADVGLLDPAGFAGEISAHLADGFVMAGRVAQTMTDAASISPIAGYRVLQTLELLLPELIDADNKIVSQGGKLVEAAAPLSEAYGTPISIPAALAAKRKGTSALAVAVRALEAVVPRPTAVAEQAAEQAAGQALAAQERS